MWRFTATGTGTGLLTLAVLLAGLQCPTTHAADLSGSEAQQAHRILQQTGVQGGLVVHLGCGDGRLTAALRAGDSYLVQGLDTDPAQVRQARQYIQSLGIYGPVAVDRYDGKQLPYIDNCVNLLVVDEPAEVAEDEMLRVLVPRGVAYVRQQDGWKKLTKPWPAELDEWTHYFHDATGNPVSHDRAVDLLRRYQWVGSPRWSRHHDHMASMSALVSSGGRIFYIMDEGSRMSIQLPARWVLVARDAFNGTILWKRPLKSWNTHIWPLKSGPAQVTRRLVAVGDRVYVTLGLDAPVSVLDAATGKTLATYEDTGFTEELIVSEGVLFAVVNRRKSRWPEYRQEFSYVWANTRHANMDWAWDEKPRRITAVDTTSGRVLWQAESPVAPMTLAADSRSVYFHDGTQAVCLDRTNGRLRWRSEPLPRRVPIPTCFGPRLLVWKDVVVFAGGTRQMAALSAETGQTLWTAPHPRSGHQSPEDLILTGGLVWAGAIANGSDSGLFTGRDPYTGEVKKQFLPDVKTYWFHHRCHSSKATDRFLITSRTGIELIDPETEHWVPHHWVRGGCIYGVMPCNGLVYAPPHSCGCYLESKLCGFNALAPESPVMARRRGGSDDKRLERGPAYGRPIAGQDESASPAAQWPTYRHDPARSGYTPAALPSRLQPAWQTRLGGRLSSVVVAGGRLFVAQIDQHTLHCLDAASGKKLWQFTAGARVDSPPTIWKGRVLFGSADGWVYCLRAADGQLVWRFRAAPADLRMGAYEQIESLWPVHGSVLVQNDVLYCVAGRSAFLDGGLHLIRLDPATGRLLSETVLDDRDPASGKNLQIFVKGLTMPVALPDVLSSDGRRVFMRSQQFDLEGRRIHVAQLPVEEQAGEGEHLFCQIGFLDDSWFFRSYWIYGRAMGGGYGGWFRAGRLAPSGRIMVFDDQKVYGFARKPELMVNASVLEYLVYAADRKLSPEAIQRVRRAAGKINAASPQRGANGSDWKVRSRFPREELWAASLNWTKEKPPLWCRALVLADKTLYLAGPPDVDDEVAAFERPDDPAVRRALVEQDAAARGRKGGLLLAISAQKGEEQFDTALPAPPVWDGMAAAEGRLFMALADGSVLCMGPEKQ